jgi:Flp pilus assembly protein TadB
MSDLLQERPPLKDRIAGELLYHVGGMAWTGVRWFLAWNLALYEAISTGVIAVTQVWLLTFFIMLMVAANFFLGGVANLIVWVWEFLCDRRG